MINRNLDEIIDSDTENLRIMGDSLKNILRVACPGIIQKFNPEEQTVTVQLSLREEVTNSDFTKTWVDLPLLLDVPIVIPRAGGYCLTMPIQYGDECLVIFSDMCIDAWFSYGGIQNQIEKRRHDLSDGFAILGVWSQPQKLRNYSLDSCELKSIDGSSSIKIKPDEININSNKVKINGKDVLTKNEI